MRFPIRRWQVPGLVGLALPGEREAQPHRLAIRRLQLGRDAFAAEQRGRIIPLLHRQSLALPLLAQEEAPRLLGDEHTD